MNRGSFTFSRTARLITGGKVYTSAWSSRRELRHQGVEALEHVLEYGAAAESALHAHRHDEAVPHQAVVEALCVEFPGHLSCP